MRETKLTVIADSLQAVLQAFRAGADSVVVDLVATGLDEVRKIRKLCESQDRGFGVLDASKYQGLVSYLCPDLEVPGCSAKLDLRGKPVDYCFWSTKFRSLVLEGLASDDPGLVFAKEAEELSLPDTKGVEVGKIRKVMKDRAEVVFSKPVAVKDVLMASNGDEKVCFDFSNPSNGRSFVSSGEVADIDFPTSSFSRKPKQESSLYCVFRSSIRVEPLNENLRFYSKPRSLSVRVLDKEVVINDRSYPVAIQEANGSRTLCEMVEDVFSSSGDSFYSLGNLTVENGSSFVQPFIPVSELRRIKRTYRQDEDLAFTSSLKILK